MDAIIEFIKANLSTIIIVLALVLVIIIALIISSSKKKSKAKKQSETTSVVDENVQEEKAKTEATNKAEVNEDVSNALVEETEKEPISKEETLEDNEEKPQENITEDFTKEEVNNVEVKMEKVEEKVSTKYAGKWFIHQKAEKEFIAVLKASNGQIVLTSESYASAKSAEAGIETIKKNVALNNFQIYTDKKDNYFYKLKDSGNKLLCIGEVYPTKSSCENSIESVKKFAGTAIVQTEIVEDLTLIEYVPQDTVEEDEANIKDQYRGKWVITKEEGDLYMATLYASNGEKLLTSEKYKSLDSVNKAIENYKTNCKNNNFIIDIAKNGMFYYKLRNSQKLTLCVGETYKTQKLCLNALESFKKFARIAKVIPYEVPTDNQ